MPLPSFQPTNVQANDPNHDTLHNNIATALNGVITTLGGPGSSPEGGNASLVERLTDIESLVNAGQVGDNISTGTVFGVVPSPGVSTSSAREDHSHGTPPVPGTSLTVVTFFYEGLLDVLVGDKPWPVPFGGELLGVVAAAATASGTNPTVLDLRLNGTSVFQTAPNPSILVGESSTSGLFAPDPTFVVPGDILLLDIGPAGVTEVGADIRDMTINLLFEVTG